MPFIQPFYNVAYSLVRRMRLVTCGAIERFNINPFRGVAGGGGGWKVQKCVTNHFKINTVAKLIKIER